jgi:hypothetical protein
LNNPVEDFSLVVESTPDGVKLSHRGPGELDTHAEDKLEPLKRAILRLVKGKRKMASVNDIEGHVTGRKAAICQAVKELQEDKLLVLVGGVFRPA